MSDLSIAELKEQIRKYELELQLEKAKNVAKREKITTMSSEVVDSNPYRYIHDELYSQSRYLIRKVCNLGKQWVISKCSLVEKLCHQDKEESNLGQF